MVTLTRLLLSSVCSKSLASVQEEDFNALMQMTCTQRLFACLGGAITIDERTYVPNISAAPEPLILDCLCSLCNPVSTLEMHCGTHNSCYPSFGIFLFPPIFSWTGTVLALVSAAASRVRNCVDTFRLGEGALIVLASSSLVVQGQCAYCH